MNRAQVLDIVALVTTEPHLSCVNKRCKLLTHRNSAKLYLPLGDHHGYIVINEYELAGGYSAEFSPGLGWIVKPCKSILLYLLQPEFWP